MQCKVCEHEMEMDFIACNDTGSSGHTDGHSYAYNIFHCAECMTIVREDVWHNPGITYLFLNNSVGRTNGKS